VGVVGTVGTIASGAYQRAARAQRAPVELTCCACPGFVEFVERGETASDQVHVLAERLLTPVRVAGVDTLLLGCTHYPFLARTIGDVMGRDVVLVSSADETAFEVRSILADTGLGRRTEGKGCHRFASSGDVRWFEELGSRLLGLDLGEVERLVWEDPRTRWA
jgi:glutamate racemase